MQLVIGTKEMKTAPPEPVSVPKGDMPDCIQEGGVWFFPS